MKIKFQGTQLDRLQFWSQYKTEIDKSIVSAVGKISYWKELLNPKVRAPADGLSFTTAEGCNRAKNILTKKFGNEYLVVNARIKTISLQTMNHYHQEKIHEFYEKQPSYVKINKWVCKKHFNSNQGWFSENRRQLTGVRLWYIHWSTPQVNRKKLHRSKKKNIIKILEKRKDVPYKSGWEIYNCVFL